MKKHTALTAILTVIMLAGFSWAETSNTEIHIYVDGNTGNDQYTGKIDQPLKTINAAVKRLPGKINKVVTIHIAAGNYKTTGGKEFVDEHLELNRPMLEKGRVRFVGNTVGFKKPAKAGSVLLDWEAKSVDALIVATEGNWSFENIQIGSRQTGQRGGITATGSAILELRDVRIHTSGIKGPGIYARYGGRIYLYGNIELNEDLCDSGGNDKNFCRIEAEYGGVVKFKQRKGATLTLGNGNLSATYYGIIELGCEKASITSWNYQSNPIAVNNSGRIDLHNTTTSVCARNPRNTPIGLEHDGHVLAEGARIIIEGKGNSNAIVLQKASSLFCNDVEIRGQVRHPLLTMSGSVLLAGINGDLGDVYSTTCSSIIIEKCTGKLNGPFRENKGGKVVLPKSRSVSTSKPAGNGKTSDGPSTPVSYSKDEVARLPSLHRAAYAAQEGKAKTLIQKGVDISEKGPYGWTPLHLAAMGGHKSMSEFLLNAGAGISAKDKSGRTAAELAEIFRHDGLAKFLREKAKSPENVK